MPLARAAGGLRRAAAIAVAVAAALVAAAPGPSHGADAAAGGVRAVPCAGCHGPFGVNDHPEIPNLAGQKQAYLVKQMMDFRFSLTSAERQRLGMRLHFLMTPQAQDFTVDEVENLAAWFASLPCTGKPAAADIPAPPPRARQADVPVPAKARRCEACHGEEGRSRLAPIPNLAGQKAAYLRRQLTVFERSADPGGAGGVAALRRHPMMSVRAREISDSEAEAIIDWVAGRGCE